MARRILGIDPGLTRCGVGVIEVGPDRRAHLVHYGVIRSGSDEPIEQRLRQIGTGIDEVIEGFAPDAVAVERVFAQHNLRTVMGTAQVSGLALYAAATRGIPVALHTPSEVKAAVTGYGSAEKRQVQTMVAKILRLDELPSPADAADALALAICHSWRGGALPSPTRPDTGDRGAGVGSTGSGETPAQRAWRAAERASSSARRRLER
ncbi:crossover junction endodeoxyribonuclease RuvC [Mycetocola reblochoni]|uniref:Crossover junction endodeoxyribonuclease RuvC n=2 Tax=Mycetocola reblochoni TaxID=331618 RepID=A0A1R4J3Y8_9MICO|nr:crossover junction endodeoxyribonuclease RuvC [Mycetocola reblochoni]RLP69489.1 crossover junction endodeoxyribonuclease RuvC [Mycetocola reblochoni]SJN26495.1 Crossover junction endodeoxyribonuclease RuvC [Mycetocola reblochoni REB411]